MDEFEEGHMPHRPVPYHPSIVAPKPVVHAAALPSAHVRELRGAARGWRTAFWVAFGLLSVGTTAFAAMLALA